MVRLRLWGDAATKLIKPILAVLAVILFVIKAYQSHDIGDLAWCVVVTMWALG